jgi:hypothetical protein
LGAIHFQTALTESGKMKPENNFWQSGHEIEMGNGSERRALLGAENSSLIKPGDARQSG